MSVSNLRSTTAATIRGARVSAAAGGDAPIKTLSFEIAVATGSIADMQDLSQSFTKKIELEKRRCEDLNNRLKVLLGKLAESRKQMPVTAEPESARQQAAKLQVLEHRLNKLTEKQNHAVCGENVSSMSVLLWCSFPFLRVLQETVNSSMRQEVDDLRRKKLQQHRIRTNMVMQVYEVLLYFVWCKVCCSVLAVTSVLSLKRCAFVVCMRHSSEYRVLLLQESEIAKAKRSLVASLQTLRQAVSARDKVAFCGFFPDITAWGCVELFVCVCAHQCRASGICLSCSPPLRRKQRSLRRSFDYG